MPRKATPRTIKELRVVERPLDVLKQMAADPRLNLMPQLLDPARVHAFEGEIVQALQIVWGDYRESPVF
jgi:methylmalonyl-CoA mutase, N-terminal domain